MNLEEIYDFPFNKVQYLAYVMAYDLVPQTVKCLKQTPLSYTAKCNHEMALGFSTEYYKTLIYIQKYREKKVQ